MDIEEARQQLSIIRRELLVGRVVQRQNVAIRPTESGYEVVITGKRYDIKDVDVAVYVFFKASGLAACSEPLCLRRISHWVAQSDGSSR